MWRDTHLSMFFKSTWFEKSEEKSLGFCQTHLFDFRNAFHEFFFKIANALNIAPSMAQKDKNYEDKNE